MTYHNLINNDITTAAGAEMFKEEAINGFEIGVQTALGYVGRFAYVPVIALLIYAVLMKIPDKYDFPIIKGNGMFKRMTFLDVARSTSLAAALAAAAGMAWIFYTEGAALALRFW